LYFPPVNNPKASGVVSSMTSLWTCGSVSVSLRYVMLILEGVEGVDEGKSMLVDVIGVVVWITETPRRGLQVSSLKV